MSFQKYQSISHKVSHLTISGKLLLFNKVCQSKYKINEYSNCYLHYDADKGLVAIELVGQGLTGASSIQTNRTIRKIYIGGFLHHFGITVEKTTRYPTMKGHKPNWILIDLSTGIAKNPKRVTVEVTKIEAL